MSTARAVHFFHNQSGVAKEKLVIGAFRAFFFSCRVGKTLLRRSDQVCLYTADRLRIRKWHLDLPTRESDKGAGNRGSTITRRWSVSPREKTLGGH
jgi:hypothetical protein